MRHNNNVVRLTQCCLWACSLESECSLLQAEFAKTWMNNKQTNKRSSTIKWSRAIGPCRRRNKWQAAAANGGYNIWKLSSLSAEDLFLAAKEWIIKFEKASHVFWLFKLEFAFVIIACRRAALFACRLTLNAWKPVQQQQQQQLRQPNVACQHAICIATALAKARYQKANVAAATHTPCVK